MVPKPKGMISSLCQVKIVPSASLIMVSQGKRTQRCNGIFWTWQSDFERWPLELTTMPVEPFTNGIPPTSRTWEHTRAFKFFGGAEEDRTPDLRIANANQTFFADI